MTMTSERPPAPRPVDRWLFAALLTAIFLVIFLANISFSYRFGRLSTVPSYDDVGYFSDALDRLTFGPNGGLGSAIWSFLAHPAHAPVSTATAMLGFWLFGPEPVAAYIANGWVLALLLVVLARISRPLADVIDRALFAAIFAFVPVVHAMVNGFMPDMAAGLVLAVALAAISSFDISRATLRQRVLLVALAVAASVVKPTAVVLTVPALAVALAVLAVSQHLSDRKQPVLRRLLPLVAGYLVAMLPIAILQGPGAVPYIYQALVSNADIWGTPGGFGFHLGYHFFGIGGQTSLSAFRWIGLAVVALDLCFMAVKPAYRERSAVNLYVTLLIIYAAMAMSNEKTLFQGSLFYLPFLIAVAHALVRLLMLLKQSAASRHAARAVLAPLVGLEVLFMPLSSAYSVFPPASAERPALMKAVTDELLRLALRNERTDACRGHGLRFGVTDLDPFPAVSVKYEMAKRRIAIEERTTYVARSFEEAMRTLDDVDAALILDPTVPSRYLNFPGMAFNRQVLDALRARPGARVDMIGAYDGKPVWLYLRPSCAPAP